MLDLLLKQMAAAINMIYLKEARGRTNESTL